MKNTLLVLVISFSFVFNLFAQSENPVSIKNFNEINLVYYEFKGPYEQSFNEFGQLMAYIQQNNIPMGMFSLGIYFDDPATVSPEMLRSEIGFSVASKAEVNGKYKFKTLPAGKAVSIKYTAMDQIVPAYEKIGKYIMDNGIKTSPFSVEFYYGSDPNVIDAEIVFYIQE